MKTFSIAHLKIEEKATVKAIVKTQGKHHVIWHMLGIKPGSRNSHPTPNPNTPSHCKRGSRGAAHAANHCDGV